ncbi:hypothetical protein JTE90_019687 [Oedothorax gibbosus]|uniref:C2H2-type domain-containing protein n=1 Tax=Oedothorax gibbosus TaxID=931172 RepID=A0AAV6UE48_9ARAC|nr:hypothetical protein JTE90_019687 [Oedothorax gibbosus]
MHSGEKPFSSKYRKEKFVKISSLNLHLREHPEEKRYVCCVCSQRFIDKYSRIDHFKEAHTEARPYVCEESKFNFEAKQYLHLYIAFLQFLLDVLVPHKNRRLFLKQNNLLMRVLLQYLDSSKVRHINGREDLDDLIRK